MTARTSYDLVIIGAGMIGSSAARHASLVTGVNICLLGPDEPKLRTDTDIFGAYFDEARITRYSSRSDTWSHLASKSYTRFAQLEKETGISFYTEAGFLDVTLDEGSFKEEFGRAKHYGGITEDLTKNYRQVYPFLNFPAKSFVICEKNGGHINPRRLVAAQQKAAEKQGIHILKEVAISLKPESNSVSQSKWMITTNTGRHLQASKVLIAVGAYGAIGRLFDDVTPGRQPKIKLASQTVAFARISESEVDRLRKMPCLVTSFLQSGLDGTYVLPPVKYPDGKWYIKLGHNDIGESELDSLNEVADWYRQQSGNKDIVQCLAQYLEYMLPGLVIEEVSGDGCVTTKTPKREPYIDEVADGVFVALGGNGYAAKSCDEIGRLAARLALLQEWQTPFQREKFAVLWEVTSKM